MEIPQVGQIWLRNNTDMAIYPPRNFKVEIVWANTLNVIYKVVEYNGEVRDGTTHGTLETEDFLVMYEKVK